MEDYLHYCKKCGKEHKSEIPIELPENWIKKTEDEILEYLLCEKCKEEK
jgi:hypothetical protein